MNIIRKGLTGFDLKYLALIFMVMDHIHYFLNLQERCQFGFPGQEDWQRHCFYFASSKDSFTHMIEKNIS